MRYQYKWKLFLEQALLEGRNQTKQAKNNYSEMSAIIDYLLDKDETPNHFVEKYTLWLAQKLKEKIDQIYDSERLRVPEEDQYDPVNHREIMEKLVTAINEYYKVEQKLKKTKPNVDGKNGYQSIDDFIDAVAQASEGRKDTEGYKKYIERASQIEGDIIYNNPKELIVVTIADNFKESCDLGYPAWCVSLPSTQGTHYNAYKNRGNKIYFIHHFFIPKAKIRQEEFSKTAIQKELNGKTTLWNEKDNSRELGDYKAWLLSKLGDEKGNRIFDSIVAAVEQNWKDKSKPAPVSINSRQQELLKSTVQSTIEYKLKYNSTIEQPPEINLDKFLLKTDYSSDDFSPNISGEWVAKLGEVDIRVKIPYKNLALETEFKNNEDLQKTLSGLLSGLVRDKGDPSVYTHCYVDNDGVEISLTLKIYGILYSSWGGSMRFSQSLGYGLRNVENMQILNKYIPDFIDDVEDTIYNLVDNKKEVSRRLFENKKTIIIRVG